VDLIRSKNSILFVRTNVKYNDIDNLLRLTQLNTNAKIDFLIVNTSNTTVVKQIPYCNSNVYIFEISDQPDLSYDIWMGNHAHWSTVLSQFSLLGYQDWLIFTLKKELAKKTLVIWGFGGAGRKIVAHITSEKDSIEIGWIVDKNTAKIGRINDTLEVKNISSLETHQADVFVLICIYGDTAEIEQTLKEMGFPKESVRKVIYEGLTPVGIG
jgi:FlaA1/EpsC-like NDP-sugar epimerase